MNSFVMNVLFTAMQNMPNMVTDIKKAISEAESSDDAKQKASSILGDMIAFLQIIEKTL